MNDTPTETLVDKASRDLPKVISVEDSNHSSVSKICEFSLLTVFFFGFY
jgi:hypothetical protein